MKKLVTLIFLLFAYFNVEAQTLEFASDEVEISGSSSATLFETYNNLTLSNANKALDLDWIFTTHDFPNNWAFNLCTGDACWSTAESVVPVSIAPDTEMDVKMQFKPNGEVGSGYVMLSFNDVTDPTISATSTFFAVADAETNITLTSVEPKFNFYPNPVVDVMNLELEHYPQVAKIGIYNLIGKEVKSFSALDNIDIIDTSDLIQGMYLITLEDSNGKLIETKRFSKVY